MSTAQTVENSRELQAATAATTRAGQTPAAAGAGLLALTFHLLDAVPPRRMHQLRQGLPVDERRRLFNRVEADLDRGLGSCWLARDEFAAIVKDCLLHFHGQRYTMEAWVLMPNHVHCIVGLYEGYTLGKIIGGIKGFSGGRINKLLEREGTVWQRDCFSTPIRSAAHLAAARDYIHNNPVAAGLCANARDWKWSSAAGG